jgi:hypothetical protein
MARKIIDFDTVREIALALPDVEEVASNLGPAFKLRGKLLACPAIHSSAEDGTLLVRIDGNLRAELLAAQPDVYYLTPHYESYPSILVRVARSDRSSLRKLLGTAWAFVGSSAPRKPRKTGTKKRAAKRR